MSDLVSGYLRDIDGLPHHFNRHFMHAAEILGYKHPGEMIRGWWLGVYVRLVDDAHMLAESEVAMDSRLSDREEGWRARADPATIA